jgi:GNAT superfamily N-acetyltransferase
MSRLRLMLDIKLLTPDDWRTLREIRLSALQESPGAFLSTYEQEEKHDPPRWRAEFVRGDWYVGIARVESADEPVSMAGITREPSTPAHQRFLEYVWVAPGFRRHGNAFNMINEVLDRLKLSGVRTVFLWVLDGNDGAMRLYEQLGFVSCNHRQPLEALPGRSEELMQRHLGLARPASRGPIRRWGAAASRAAAAGIIAAPKPAARGRPRGSARSGGRPTG